MNKLILTSHPPSGQMISFDDLYKAAQLIKDDAKPLVVKFKKLHPQAKMPTRATDGSSGYDLYAVEGVAFLQDDRRKIDTGIAIELPRGYEAQVRPRSGLTLKGFDVKLGTVDADFRGSIGVIAESRYYGTFNIQPGERIAQLVFQKVELPELVEVEELDSTARGESGFGSSGTGELQLTTKQSPALREALLDSVEEDPGMFYAKEDTDMFRVHHWADQVIGVCPDELEPTPKDSIDRLLAYTKSVRDDVAKSRESARRVLPKMAESWSIDMTDQEIDEADQNCAECKNPVCCSAAGLCLDKDEKADQPNDALKELMSEKPMFDSVSDPFDSFPWMPDPMPETNTPKTPTLEETLAGADRAAERVAKWPQWKKDLSPSNRDVPDPFDDLPDDIQRVMDPEKWRKKHEIAAAAEEAAERISEKFMERIEKERLRDKLAEQWGCPPEDVSDATVDAAWEGRETEPPKAKPTGAIRVNLYEIVRRAIEEGVEYGWNRAHKHNDTPERWQIFDAIETAVMGNLCEVLHFEDGDSDD